MVSILQTLFYAWGSNRSPNTTFFIILLSVQLSLRREYDPAPDYLTRLLPLYNPNLFVCSTNNGLLGFLECGVKSLLGILNSVPDNACQRSKFGSNLTFDFIVVGGGAAGSVIAAGLCKKWRVLLVEAGGDPVVDSVPPQLFPYGLKNSKIWDYHSEETNTSCKAYKNGCPNQCGKQLSGSTGTNAMQYVCGQDRDYDGWEALGNPGWNYKAVLELIKKSERNLDKKRNSTYHGFKGKLSVGNTDYTDAFKGTVIKGMNNMGYKTLHDYNSQQYNGVVDLQSTIKKGERVNAYLAFIEPVKNSPNLFIIKNGLVTNILLNGTIAIGVNVSTSISDCPYIQFKASKEVIVSAGSLNSPKILLQSGIGPRKHLKSIGINVSLDLPGVGQNLHDHIYAVHYLTLPKAQPQNVIQLFVEAFKYLIFRKGFFAHLSNVNINGFINASDTETYHSDMQYLFNRIDRGVVDFKVAMENFRLKDEHVAKLSEINELSDIVQIYTVYLNPKSRGRIELRDNNPESKPKIISNFFAEDEDVKKIVEGINKLHELVETDAFKNVFAKFVKFNISECNDKEYNSDEYKKCYIKHFSALQWHPTGSCKMGPETDKMAVVDATLKVYGIMNLRVADASIMPNITSGNTQCIAYAIGQKAVEEIIKRWT